MIKLSAPTCDNLSITSPVRRIVYLISSRTVASYKIFFSFLKLSFIIFCKTSIADPYSQWNA